MIAADQQGNGYGKKAMELLIEHVKTRPNATCLGTSCVQDGGAFEFYKKLGFVDTGEVEDNEAVLTLMLD